MSGGGSGALVCNKKQECLSKDKRLWLEQEQLLHHFHSLTSLLPPQLDYTDAGTCDKCFEKRKNVSHAAEPCSCTVVFNIDKRFKVKQHVGPALEWTSNPLQNTNKPGCWCCCSRETSSSITASETSTRTSADTWTPETTHRWQAERKT